jgi:tRNA-modifying protein YgfZ
MSSREITELSNQVRPPESWVDQNVAWHYGDPLREQKNLVNGLGVVDLSNRGIIRISGDDRKKFLHSITSHHIERLNDGQSETTLLLSQTGHIEHELHVIEKDQSLWLIVEESSKQAVLDFLNKMIFMSRVEITDEKRN